MRTNLYYYIKWQILKVNIYTVSGEVVYISMVSTFARYWETNNYRNPHIWEFATRIKVKQIKVTSELHYDQKSDQGGILWHLK